ncbi:hypothetical protein QYF61_013661 [Mycteria americana]|uniref:Uncharacterized protein n=1 Tax=Mycteria americana TaxID=33587 RepID=A0AAN7NMJ2_MYCAM|nr:hypothetical protein QYF61_013661 [Mycteria americana]
MGSWALGRGAERPQVRLGKASTNARGDLGSTKHDYMGLGTVVKGMGPQVVFFILLGMVGQQGKRLLVQAAAFLVKRNAYGEGKTALLGEHIVTWLLWCWDKGASSLELEGKEAKQLGSLSREGDIDKAIGKGAQVLSLWRRLLSGMKERYPFKEDVICHPGKWTTMERGTQYLRELAMPEVIYDDLDNKQLSKDPDEVKCTQPMWQKFVWSTPASYANSLAVMTWKDGEGQMVDELAGQLQQYEESLSSSLRACISAVEKLPDTLAKKLSQDFQRLKEGMSCSPPVLTSIPAIRSKHSSAQERGCSGYTPRATLWFHLRERNEDMRKRT